MIHRLLVPRISFRQLWSNTARPRAQLTCEILRPICVARMALSVDFRDEQFFPTFDSCPDDNDLALDYYVPEGGFLRPRRHWCLLAEITDVAYFIRLRLVVRDKSGGQFPVAFYLDNDEVFNPSLYQIGNKIAVLYPHQHGFLDMTVGLRLETMKHIHVSTCRIPKTDGLPSKDYSAPPD